MRRETVLVVCAIVVVAGLFGAAAVASDVLATHDDGADERQPSADLHLDTQEVTMTPEEIGGETVTLSVDLLLRQDVEVDRGFSIGDVDDDELRSENVSVQLRATNRETGMIEDVTDLNVDPIAGERDFSVSGSITLDRENDYGIEAIVSRDNRRIEIGRTRVSGLDTLEPEYADSPVEFERFSIADLPAVSYTVEDAGDDEADLGVSAYVTNTGDELNDAVEVELIARQTDSNIVADSDQVTIGAIRPSRTETAESTLTVPDSYNYHLDAVVWRDGVIVDSIREGATLDPDEPAPANETETDADEETVEVEEFATDDVDDDDASPGDDEADAAPPAGDDVEEDDEQPGFGIAAAVVALIGAVAVAARTAQRSTATQHNQ